MEVHGGPHTSRCRCAGALGRTEHPGPWSRALCPRLIPVLVSGYGCIPLCWDPTPTRHASAGPSAALKRCGRGQGACSLGRTRGGPRVVEAAAVGVSASQGRNDPATQGQSFVLLRAGPGGPQMCGVQLAGRGSKPPCRGGGGGVHWSWAETGRLLRGSGCSLARLAEAPVLTGWLLVGGQRGLWALTGPAGPHPAPESWVAQPPCL